jgi:VanZ family protein
MRQLAQATGWVLLFAIAVVSLVPPGLRPETGVPHKLEHAAIFLLAGFAFGVGYSNGFLRCLLGLTLFTVAIELAQLWIPGRHARLFDLIIDAISIGTGLVVGSMLVRVRQRA